MRIPASLPVPGVLTAFLLAAAQGPGPAPAGAAVPGRRRHGSAPPRHMQITCKSYANHTAATRRCVTGRPRYANETRGLLFDWSHPGAQQPMMRGGGWSRESWAGAAGRKWRAGGRWGGGGGRAEDAAAALQGPERDAPAARPHRALPAPRHAGRAGRPHRRPHPGPAPPARLPAAEPGPQRWRAAARRPRHPLG